MTTDTDPDQDPDLAVDRRAIRLSVRAIVIGFWSAVVGLLVLYVSLSVADLAPTPRATTAGSAAGATTGVPVVEPLTRALVALWSGGVVAVVLGAVLAVVGVRVLRTAS